MLLVKKPLIPYILILGSCIAVFWPICGYDFIIWDDGLNIYTNPYMNPPSLENVLFFWTNAFQGLFIPVTYTVWSLLAWISGALNINIQEGTLHPGIFHSANLAVHIVTNIVLYKLICFILPYTEQYERRDRSKTPVWFPALCGTLFFALHPIQVEAVAWITDMKDLLCALFFVTGVWLFLLAAEPKEKSNGTEKQSKIYYCCSFLAFILAILSKPLAVTFPIVTLLICQTLFGGPIVKRVVSLLPWILTAIPFVIITKLQQPDQSIGYITPIYLRPFIAGDALAFYLVKLFYPLNLGMDYNRPPQYVLSHWWGYTTWFIPISVFLTTLFSKNKTLLLSLGVLVCSLIPVLGFLPFLFQQFSTVTDHYLYIPMFGAAIAFAWFINVIPVSKKIATGGTILLLLAILTHMQIRHWENTFTIMSHTSTVNPRSYVAHTNLGKYYYDKGTYSDAAGEYIEAIRINPTDSKHRNNLAAAYTKMGQPQDAVRNYLHSIYLDPNFAIAHKNLAEILVEQGAIKEAAGQYKELLRINPNDIKSRKKLEEIQKRLE